MLSDKCNSITTKATALIFHCSMSLWPERCLLAYHSTLYGLTSVLLYVPFIFADSEKCQLVVARDGFPS